MHEEGEESIECVNIRAIWLYRGSEIAVYDLINPESIAAAGVVRAVNRVTASRVLYRSRVLNFILVFFGVSLPLIYDRF